MRPDLVFARIVRSSICAVVLDTITDIDKEKHGSVCCQKCKALKSQLQHRFKLLRECCAHRFRFVGLGISMKASAEIRSEVVMVFAWYSQMSLSPASRVSFSLWLSVAPSIAIFTCKQPQQSTEQQMTACIVLQVFAIAITTAIEDDRSSDKVVLMKKVCYIDTAIAPLHHL